MESIEEIINKNGIYIGKTKGDSMQPMIREGKDSVVIIKPSFPLKKYDVPVYRRDGHYTMHRIVKVTKKGYIICGDNRVHLEKDITDRDIIGVLSGFYHGEKYVDCADKEYVKYSKAVCKSYLLRVFKYMLRKIIRKIR